jgi:hypothetical protein
MQACPPVAIIIYRRLDILPHAQRFRDCIGYVGCVDGKESGAGIHPL